MEDQCVWDPPLADYKAQSMIYLEDPGNLGSSLTWVRVWTGMFGGSRKSRILPYLTESLNRCKCLEDPRKPGILPYLTESLNRCIILCLEKSRILPYLTDSLNRYVWRIPEVWDPPSLDWESKQVCLEYPGSPGSSLTCLRAWTGMSGGSWKSGILPYLIESLRLDLHNNTSRGSWKS